MKRFMILSISIFTYFHTIAQIPAVIEEKAKSNPDLATVIIYRTPQFDGAASNWAVFESGKRICKLSNKKYLIYQRKPGNSDFRVQIGGVVFWPKKVTGLKILLEAGEIYFIKTNMKTSFTRSRVELVEVTIRSAKKELPKLSLDNCTLEEMEKEK